MPQKFHLDEILLRTRENSVKPESALFTPDQASKVYLCIIHECAL